MLLSALLGKERLVLPAKGDERADGNGKVSRCPAIGPVHGRRDISIMDGLQWLPFLPNLVLCILPD